MVKNSIRICLFNPINVRSYPPLNLTYLSSYLKKYGKYEYNIKLIDVNCCSKPIQKIISFNPHIVAFTSFSPHLIDIYNMSASLRRKNKNIIQICGGIHATINPKETILIGNFDIAVIGEGEVTFAELVDQYIKNGKKLDKQYLSLIKGIAYRDKDRVQITPPRELISDINEIPHPDRELLNNNFYYKRYYIMRGMNTNGVFTLAASRGCPFQCIFCCSNFTTKGKVRFHSTKYIIEEIEELVYRHKAKWLFFTDDTFFIDKKKIKELCEMIIENKLHKRVNWEVQLRSNLVSVNDLSLLKLMKKAGCEQIDYGFETGNQRVLTLIKGKGITLDDHQRAIDLTDAAGIKVMGTFVFGTPTETYEEMLDTKNFIIKNYHKINRLQTFCMTPYPGTPLYEICVKRGIISNNYYEEIKKEKDRNCPHMENVYSDTISREKVLEVKKEIDVISFKKVRFYEKIKWFFYNLLHNINIVGDGLKWVVSKARK